MIFIRHFFYFVVYRMSYYRRIGSLSELIGDEGYLRLPSYVLSEFILDDQRRDAVEKALVAVKSGRNVLIIGPPGTGKTALMAYIVKRLIDQGYDIGIILEGATIITNEHTRGGVILIYDDLPRMNVQAIKSMVKNRVQNIITTARTEELSYLRRTIDVDLRENFHTIEIGGMSPQHLRKMLLKYSEKEGVKIQDQAAIDVVVEKAEGLPIYIWQVVRELKINRKSLTMEYAGQIPQGMLDYVDDILWRILDEHPERYEILLTLLIMCDLQKYAIHQDVYNYIFITAKEIRTGKKYKLEDALFSDLLNRITRYLAREAMTYSFRLPHDSWGDVLKGKSNGPMSGEISMVNTAYPKPRRREILIEACNRAWYETVEKSGDTHRINALKSFAQLNNILLRRPVEEKPKPAEMQPKAPPEAKPAPSPRPSPIEYEGIIRILLEHDEISPEHASLLKQANEIAKEYLSTRDKSLLRRAERLYKNIPHPIALYNLGVIYYELGQYSKAFEHLQRIYTWRSIISPQLTGNAEYYIALCYLRFGMPLKALEHLVECLKYNPDRDIEEAAAKLARKIRLASVYFLGGGRE